MKELLVNYHKAHIFTVKELIQQTELKTEGNKAIITIHDHNNNDEAECHEMDIEASFTLINISISYPNISFDDFYTTVVRLEIDLENRTVLADRNQESRGNDVYIAVPGFEYHAVYGYCSSKFHAEQYHKASSPPLPWQYGYITKLSSNVIVPSIAHNISINKIMIKNIQDGEFITYTSSNDHIGYICKVPPEILYEESQKINIFRGYSVDKSTQTDADFNFDIDASQSFSLVQDSIKQKSVAIKECVDEFNSKLGNIMNSFQELQLNDNSFQMAAIEEFKESEILGNNSNIDFH